MWLEFKGEEYTMGRFSFAVIGALALAWAVADSGFASAQTRNYYKPNFRTSPSTYVSPYPGQRWVGPSSGSGKVFNASGRGQMIQTSPNSMSLRYNVPSGNSNYTSPYGYSSPSGIPAGGGAVPSAPIPLASSDPLWHGRQ
jgi:hypothetical protein